MAGLDEHIHALALSSGGPLRGAASAGTSAPSSGGPLRGAAVEQLHGHAFVSLLQLESGARFGLAVRLRQDLGPATWARVVDRPSPEPSVSPPVGPELMLFLEGNEKHFVEVLENGRAALESVIEAGAAARGLPVDETLLSFPAVALVRALLATRSPHYCRLALLFVMPSELRDLRDAIEPLIRDTAMPQLVRDLANRLVPPVGPAG